MLRSYKRKGTKGKWTVETLVKAIKCVKNNTMSIPKAAKN